MVEQDKSNSVEILWEREFDPFQAGTVAGIGEKSIYSHDYHLLDGTMFHLELVPFKDDSEVPDENVIYYPNPEGGKSIASGRFSMPWELNLVRQGRDNKDLNNKIKPISCLVMIGDEIYKLLEEIDRGIGLADKGVIDGQKPRAILFASQEMIKPGLMKLIVSQT